MAAENHHRNRYFDEALMGHRVCYCYYHEHKPSVVENQINIGKEKLENIKFIFLSNIEFEQMLNLHPLCDIFFSIEEIYKMKQ
jgi:hypothetical protein